MGFLGSLLRLFRKPPPMTLDNLFTLPDASVDLERNGIVFAGKAGVSFKAPETKEFGDLQEDIKAILKGAGSQFDVAWDDYGYTWVVISGDMAMAVASIDLVYETLKDADYDKYLLCAVFEFRKDDRPIYWIYNKHSLFYPFAPQGKERDVLLELRLRNLAPATLPLETSLSQWFPLWDLPFRQPGP